MKTILVIGAGKSTQVLIDYLLKQSQQKDRRVIVADTDINMAEQRVHQHPFGSSIALDISNEEALIETISRADLVVSMVPAFLHHIVAKQCLRLKKHFFSASYQTPEMVAIAVDVESSGLFFLNECGVDPGIDHMSAMKIIHDCQAKDQKITLFKSFCGGLLSPAFEMDNPWRYKFTWNPRNVVLAGQGVSRFIRNGKIKYIPYPMLFRRTERVTFRDVGDFDAYPNRDSLQYREIYGIKEIPTLIRGTLRRAGFCKSWDVLVQLGMTDNSFQVDLPGDYTYRMFLNTFLPYDPFHKVEDKLKMMFPEISVESLSKLEWLGLFSHAPLPSTSGSPAEILQAILEEKWKLGPLDCDMVVLQHQFEITHPDLHQEKIISSMVIHGDQDGKTAMSKTVGLPLAIAVDLFMEGTIKGKGMLLPVHPYIYTPILKALENEGIVFKEERYPLE